MKNYTVTLIVTETHYLNLKAKNKEDAKEQAESYGVNSFDAHSTTVEAVSAKEEKLWA
jgi:hypothetical protein|tara:strand:+ start:223 stop:396 length:174 start_codon:yes stop_codon:yes gene_type:complete